MIVCAVQCTFINSVVLLHRHQQYPKMTQLWSIKLRFHYPTSLHIQSILLPIHSMVEICVKKVQ